MHFQHPLSVLAMDDLYLNVYRKALDVHLVVVGKQPCHLMHRGVNAAPPSLVVPGDELFIYLAVAFQIDQLTKRNLGMCVCVCMCAREA